MTTGKALNGKPYAGNPHVRFDEGEVASAAMPRRGSLLYNSIGARICATSIFAACCISVSAEITYNGAGSDLASPQSWGLESFPSTDWYKLDGSAADFPTDGFSLSADMPVSDRITLCLFPARTVTLAAKGFSLNCDQLWIQNMYQNDNDRFNPFSVTGGFSGLKQLIADTKCNLQLLNGVYHIDNVKFYNWFPTLAIGEGAELSIDLINGENQSYIDGNCSYPNMRIENGGIYHIVARDESKDKNWMRAYYRAYSERAGKFEILNGGAYIDDSKWPSDIFCGNMNVRIDGGTYLATNSTFVARNTRWGGIRGTTFALTNSTMKLSNFYIGYCDKDGFGNWDDSDNPIGTRLTFHNSEETFAFATSYAESIAAAGRTDIRNGLGFGPYSQDNSLLIDGDDNKFSAEKMIVGGTNNVVTIGGGTFDLSVSMHFRNGISNTVNFTGGKSTIKSLQVDDDVADMRMSVSGDAEVAINTTDQTGSISVFRRFSVPGSKDDPFVVAGKSFSVRDTYLDFDRDGAEMRVMAGVSTGDVAFTSQNGTAFFGDGTVHTAIRPTLWRNSVAAVQTVRFENGTSGNRLVLSNATYRCEKPFLSKYVYTAEGPTTEAVPFTGCPDSYIEFQGDHPKFIVTSGVPNPNSGAAWYSFALGEMIDYTEVEYTNSDKSVSMRYKGWKTDRYQLDNPLKLRFVLPTGGYASAPFECTGTAGVLGGNAKFEFDLGNFKWPKVRTRIPLVKDVNKFTGWGGRKFVDIDGLNLTNADALPTLASGASVHKAKLVMSDDGSTLELDMPGNAGFAIIFE